MNTTTNANDSSLDLNEQPCRNLTKAFEALCSVSPDETCKEEKSDVFDDLNVVATNIHAMLSPVSVVMNVSSSTAMTGLVSKQLPTNTNTGQQDEVNGVFSSMSASSLPITAMDSLEPDLHPDLRLNLSTYTARRVACYSIIHDINKEAVTMAAHDPLMCHEIDSISPLILAAQGLQYSSITISYDEETSTAVEFAVIDEEKWLLKSISNRTPRETATNTSTQCPATFLQAMGEKDYDFMTTSATTRTQLWKPSRSWWEAKSGKNPWIEPASHNKRWRYLWPLIHYHKFLHKCVKKLKRNGVDVKASVSPVSVFLREEVCAISDHLAVVSLFGSDEWMDCLEHFDGWTDVSSNESIQEYKSFVMSLPLRSIQEPVDVDSPLLRNQIDEAFLRTIALQREQMRESDSILQHPQGAPSISSSSKKTRNQQGATTATATTTATAVSHYGGPPPMYPRGMTQHSPHHLHQQIPVPRQINGVRRARYYPTNGWYPGHTHPGWDNLPLDASSVHSELSANSYPQPHHHHTFMDAAAHYHHPIYPSNGAAAYNHRIPPLPPHCTTANGGVQSDHSNSTGYTYPDQYGGWMDPAMAAYAMHQHHQYLSSPQYYGAFDPSSVYASPPISTATDNDTEHPIASDAVETEIIEDAAATPYKYDPDNSYTMQSPYWSHLDQATMAMGLATPAMVSPSTTPRRTIGGSGTSRKQNRILQNSKAAEGEAATKMAENEGNSEDVNGEYPRSAVAHCAPLLLHGHGQYHPSSSNVGSTAVNQRHTHYYPFDTAAARNVVPPSPATQFMMSPQASFAYNYGYGFSPARMPRRNSVNGSSNNYNRPRLGASSISTATTTPTSNSVGNEGNNPPMAIDTSSPPNSKVNDVTSTNDDMSTTAKLNSGTVGSVFESPMLVAATTNTTELVPMTAAM
jgi:hypothetical protein